MKKKFRITYNAPVILTFIFICLIVTILNYITSGTSNRVAFMTYHSVLTSPMTYVRFVTYVFGHGSWEHFIGNSSYLLLLGPVLEEKYGSIKLLEVMGITTIVTSVIHYICFPYAALCGASGIVFAFILLISFTDFKEGEIPLTFILVAVLFLGQQVGEGIFVKDNVSQFAHILGGITGGVSGYLLNKK